MERTIPHAKTEREMLSQRGRIIERENSLQQSRRKRKAIDADL